MEILIAALKWQTLTETSIVWTLKAPTYYEMQFCMQLSRVEGADAWDRN